MDHDLKELLEIKYKRLMLVKNGYEELLKLPEVQSYVAYIREYNNLRGEIRELESVNIEPTVSSR